MTLRRYRDVFNIGGSTNPYSVYNNINYNNYQNITIAANNHYTSGGYDLINNVNQRVLHINNNAYPIDRVSGYSAVQLQNALVGAKSWNDWRDKIKNDYSNSTESFVDELFANWQD